MTSSPPIRRRESTRAGSTREPLFHRSWLPAADPRRAILVVHGFAEHSGRYDAFGEWFARRGTAVHAYDQFGHGRSGGHRGYVERFDTFLDDCELMLEHLGQEHPDLPHYLVGHSMGGLVTTSLLRERKPRVHGAATSGSALVLSERMKPAEIAVARLLRRIAPRLSRDGGIDLAALSRDPEVGARYEADPLVFRAITVGLAVELYDASRRTAGGGADVDVPMLLLHGESDPLCPARASRELHADLASEGSELRVYPELRHEIFNEPEAESIFQDLLDWLGKREA